jgi:hypothetical protein
MERIGRELLEKSKQSLQSVEKVEKSTLKGRDILTLLLRANMATDLPEHQRMSEEEVVSRKLSRRCYAYRDTPLRILIILQKSRLSWLRVMKRQGTSAYMLHLLLGLITMSTLAARERLGPFTH